MQTTRCGRNPAASTNPLANRADVCRQGHLYSMRLTGLTRAARAAYKTHAGLILNTNCRGYMQATRCGRNSRRQRRALAL